MLIVPIGTCYYVVWCDNFYAQIPRSPAVLISFAATLILLLIRGKHSHRDTYKNKLLCAKELAVQSCRNEIANVFGDWGELLIAWEQSVAFHFHVG